MPQKTNKPVLWGNLRNKFAYGCFYLCIIFLSKICTTQILICIEITCTFILYVRKCFWFTIECVKCNIEVIVDCF